MSLTTPSASYSVPPLTELLLTEPSHFFDLERVKKEKPKILEAISATLASVPLCSQLVPYPKGNEIQRVWGVYKDLRSGIFVLHGAHQVESLQKMAELADRNWQELKPFVINLFPHAEEYNFSIRIVHTKEWVEFSAKKLGIPNQGISLFHLAQQIYDYNFLRFFQFKVKSANKENLLHEQLSVYKNRNAPIRLETLIEDAECARKWMDEQLVADESGIFIFFKACTAFPNEIGNEKNLTSVYVLKHPDEPPPSLIAAPLSLTQTPLRRFECTCEDFRYFPNPGLFSNLQVLILQNTGFKQFPDGSDLSRLTELSLTGSTIETFPEETRFDQLEQLNLARTPFLHFPRGIRLDKLWKLNLSKTKIETLPPLPRVQNLDVSETPIRNLPTGYTLPEVQEANFSGCCNIYLVKGVFSDKLTKINLDNSSVSRYGLDPVRVQIYQRTLVDKILEAASFFNSLFRSDDD